MIKFNDFIDVRFWVSSGRNDWDELIWFLTFFALLFFAGVIIGIYLKFGSSKNPLIGKYIAPLAWSFVGFGALGALFVFFRKEGVAFLSAHAFWAINILSLVFLLAFFSWRFFKNYPKDRDSYDSYQLKKRYLPTRKHK
ncbi:MAG: hypothetical protein WD231_04780 [Candidatus Woykebacteria bacterium]